VQQRRVALNSVTNEENFMYVIYIEKQSPKTDGKPVDGLKEASCQPKFQKIKTQDNSKPDS
jgi:hypothetical protein